MATRGSKVPVSVVRRDMPAATMSAVPALHENSNAHNIELSTLSAHRYCYVQPSKLTSASHNSRQVTLRGNLAFQLTKLHCDGIS